MAGSKLRSALATLNTRDQNIEALNRVVAHILNVGGCGHCGRIAVLSVEFLGDPPPDLAKSGVISFGVEAE